MDALTEFLFAARGGRPVVRDLADLTAVLSTGAGRMETVNLYQLALLESVPGFRPVMAAADVWSADGWPVRMLLRLAGRDVERVTGAELCRLIIDAPLQAFPVGRIALIGGPPENSTLLAALLSRQGRSLVFSEHGDRDSWVATELADRLETSGAQLTLVAVTSPWSEQLAAQLRSAGAPGWIVGVGGGVDVAVGRYRAAPAWLGRIGGEWLWRLAQEPRRLWRRYLLDCLPFLLRRAPGAVWRVRAARSVSGS